jgi:hypothetical protein
VKEWRDKGICSNTGLEKLEKDRQSKISLRLCIILINNFLAFENKKMVAIS